MEENQTQPMPMNETKEEQPEPQVVNPPVSTQNSQPEGKKSKATLYVIIGIIVLLVVFAAAIVILNSSADKPEESTTTTTTSTEIKDSSDLDKISNELDNADLDSYEADLKLNDDDASAF